LAEIKKKECRSQLHVPFVSSKIDSKRTIKRQQPVATKINVLFKDMFSSHGPNKDGNMGRPGLRKKVS
jgi:hypothetical protein